MVGLEGAAVSGRIGGNKLRVGGVGLGGLEVQFQDGEEVELRAYALYTRQTGQNNEGYQNTSRQYI